ncbi:RHS repeat-associated core domain-containing protein [Treponema sp. OMZ 798]|uniref:RHS repeat-associated core domain-containing protein n=1 Tax=unclassified Treponema TaxID=2638727 RepID=UPI0035325088
MAEHRRFFLYQGQYLDTETELVYNYKRYYSQKTGAYISQDPIGLAGGNPTLLPTFSM